MPDSVRVATLAAFAQDVALPMGLTLSEVEVQTEGASFEEGQFRLAEPGQVVVRISAESLTAFVALQMPPIIREPRVEFKDGFIRATASVKVLVEVTATGVLKPVLMGDEEIHLEVVDFEGPAVARGILEKQMEQQNPVFKAIDAPFPLSMSKVIVTEFLEIHGTWTLPALGS